MQRKEISLGRLKGLVKAQLNEVASPVGADITQGSRKKEIPDGVVSHLGLRVGNENEMTPEHRQDDTRPSTSTGAGREDSTQIDLAKLELEKERMRAENLRLEEELIGLASLELKDLTLQKLQIQSLGLRKKMWIHSFSLLRE